MSTENKYWKGHPAFVTAKLIASIEHDSGTWESFEVLYKDGGDLYHGGPWLEFYWNGDSQESLPFNQVTNPQEQLEQFIEFWLDDNRG